MQEDFEEVPEEIIEDTPSNPEAEGHLPVAGEITEEDHQISSDVLEDLNGSSSNTPT